MTARDELWDPIHEVIQIGVYDDDSHEATDRVLDLILENLPLVMEAAREAGKAEQVVREWWDPYDEHGRMGENLGEMREEPAWRLIPSEHQEEQDR